MAAVAAAGWSFAPGRGAPAAASQASAPAAAPLQLQEISWVELVPPDWDPTSQIKQINADKLQDGSAEAERLMKQMQSAMGEESKE